jgi:hypothetical protein
MAINPTSLPPEVIRRRARALPIHEAGHAIIARVLGVPAGRTSIESNDRGAGFAEVAEPEECLQAWKAQGRTRPSHFAIDAAIIISLAGVVAERYFFSGQDTGGHGLDLSDVDRYLPIDPGGLYQHRLERMTWMLIRRHRSRIELLAAMLRARRTLSGPEIDRVYYLGRPVPEDK